MEKPRPTAQEEWQEEQTYTREELELARKTLREIEDGKEVFKAIRSHPLPDGEGFLSKHTLITAYREDISRGVRDPDRKLLAKIRVKPTRTLSGVTTVTVLTKPFPCPGECVYCPDHDDMPVSYLPDEPGAMRALQHEYDPYQQVRARIDALYEIGHPTDKIELLILGGSWSAYREEYQTWFIRRCFEAMNERPADTLKQAQAENEQARHKNVGLVVETRPDLITRDELARLRHLGVTKVQLGVQSMDDQILALNKRGHQVRDTIRAVALLRAAGFKIVVHWMPNLVGASLASDREDFSRLWDQLAPDELKIYPTQLLEHTELHQIWQRGGYRPYTTEQLIELIAALKLTIPRYCRVNRIVRDIPSQNVVEGNKRTSLRQDIHRVMDGRDQYCQCIRCREVRGRDIDVDSLELEDLVYRVNGCEEHFLSFRTEGDQIAGFLRLTLPGEGALETGLKDLAGAAVIREVHVYGQSLRVGQAVAGAAQHAGLGTALLEQAETAARRAGFSRIAVISAVGTREYYQDRGYNRGNLYLVKNL